MDCPICLEESSDVLSCGHYCHIDCVQNAAEAFQIYLESENKPQRTFARCPICRADLVDQHITWYGQITLNKMEMEELLNELRNGNGIIEPQSLPTFMIERMPYSHPLVQSDFATRAATMLWISYIELPNIMKFRKVFNNRQRVRKTGLITF